MPQLTKITTRRGDDGRTDLADGARVGKDSPRIRVLGALDELSSTLGLALSLSPQPECAEELCTVQRELFGLGAALSRTARKGKSAGPSTADADIKRLETKIQALQKRLGPLENFLLPGGCPAAAAIHLARTTCRRAERELVALGRKAAIPPASRIYLNRLSDLLFQLARLENKAAGISETVWEGHKPA
jgi:cob(I)alamin adenosyltransferase